MRISDVTTKRHNFYFSLFLLNINCNLVTQTVSKVTQAAWCLRGYKADTWIWKIARLMCILKANSCRQSTHLKCLWKLVVATIPLETVRSRAYGKLVWVFWSFCWILKTSPKVCLSQISEENSLQRLVGYLDTVWEGGFLFHFVFSLEQLFKSHLLPPWQPVTRWKQMPLGTIAGTGPPTSVAFFPPNYAKLHNFLSSLYDAPEMLQNFPHSLRSKVWDTWQAGARRPPLSFLEDQFYKKKGGGLINKFILKNPLKILLV